MKSSVLIYSCLGGLDPIADRLIALDMDVVTVSDLQELAKKLAQISFDLVILDGVDRKSLYKLAEDVRKTELNSSTPILFLSVFRMDFSSVFSGFANGPVNSVTKPYKMSSVLNNVNILINLQMQKKKMEKINATLEKSLVELRETQKQLVQAAKLASLGEISAGLAHELNNPLFIVSANASQIAAGFQDKSRYGEEEMIGFVEAVRGNAKRMQKIIKHVKGFARQTENRLSKFNIDELVEKSFTLFVEQLRLRNIKLEKNLNADIAVKCDPNQLEQVMVNLFSNARDAISDQNGDAGGTLMVTTRVKDETVEISVEDDGCGIPLDVQERIFDPFFTTKETGKGTGLGLSIAYGIIKEHRGTICVCGKRERGSQFTVTLPIPREEETKEAG